MLRRFIVVPTWSSARRWAAPGVRPYASGGIGLIRASAGNVGAFFDVDDNRFGVNAGVGVVGFVREHFGSGVTFDTFAAFRTAAPEVIYASVSATSTSGAPRLVRRSGSEIAVHEA